VQNDASGFLHVGNMRHTITVKFGSALRKRRISLGLTQEDLAKITGLNRSYISDVELGKVGISLERADKLANAVNCILRDLISNEQEK
jgi:transcriptional regulator with XRE-family HTH domain